MLVLILCTGRTGSTTYLNRQVDRYKELEHNNNGNPVVNLGESLHKAIRSGDMNMLPAEIYDENKVSIGKFMPQGIRHSQNPTASKEVIDFLLEKASRVIYLKRDWRAVVTSHCKAAFFPEHLHRPSRSSGADPIQVSFGENQLTDRTITDFILDTLFTDYFATLHEDEGKVHRVQYENFFMHEAYSERYVDLEYPAEEEAELEDRIMFLYNKSRTGMLANFKNIYRR